MRSRFSISLFVSLLMLGAASSAHAQKQEKTLYQRIMHPNRARAYSPDGHSINKKSYHSGKDSAYVKSYQYDQQFSPKGFHTSSFDTHRFWSGKFKFKTKAADTNPDIAIHNVNKKYGQKSAPVKTAPQSGKTDEVKTYETGKYAKKGKSQQVINSQKTDQVGAHVLNNVRSMKPLNINDIRKLLNKLPNK